LVVKLAGKVTRVSQEAYRNFLLWAVPALVAVRRSATDGREFHSMRSFCWIPGPTCDTLNLYRQGADFHKLKKETGAHIHA
jgi:hypothetical protein